LKILPHQQPGSIAGVGTVTAVITDEFKKFDNTKQGKKYDENYTYSLV
jgi:hypothetical protein